MKTKISAPRGKDVRDFVKIFNLSTDDPDDQAFLAALYRIMFLTGGTVTLNECGNSDSDTYHFRIR